MADEFEEALDGRLVIATDDERMDCTESAVSGAGEDRGNVSAVAHNSSSKGPTKTEFENVGDNYASHPKKVEQNCWEGDSPLSVPNSVLDSFKAKCNSNETAEGIDESDIKMQKLPAELVKWEELDGGVVPISEGKPVESDRKSRVFDLETKGHLSSESNKSPATPQYQHGVHNFLRGGTESRKKKLMLDKGTCVLSRPTGVQGLDEHLLALRPGTNLTIDITIICKAGSNTLYISAKWKGREYHGVLTDGEPLFSHTYAQKRNAAQNAEKLVLETGSGNSGGAANQKVQNSEKASASGVGGKRGGKRGVGGHSKGGGIEKRAKNHSAECQSGGDAGDEAGGRSSKNDDKVRFDVDEGVADAAELGGIRQTIEKPLAHSHGHFQHQQQSRRRRTSSSASSGVSTVGSKSGLYDGDAVSRIRCPHQLCGHRFEKTNGLNAHLLVGTHGVAGAKAKIFESSASQTTAVQLMSTGCDPFFPSDRMMPNNTKSVSFCTKCQKELAPETEDEGEGPLSKAKRPELLEFGGSGEKNRQKGATDNSPGFSDISDDTAPTLEKEESFDKQTEEAKKVSSTPAAPVPSLDALNGPAMAVDPSPSPHSQNSCIKDGLDIANKNAIATPPKGAAVSINRQNLLPHGNKAKTADESPANDAAKTAKKMSCSSIVSTIAKTPTTTGTGNMGEPTTNNPYLLASASDITTPNAVPSGFPFNPFFSYAPHLTQALASAIAQGTVPINAVSSSASPLGSSSVALSTGFKRMSPPCAAGLLSLGTPLAASANQTPNGGGAPSKSAEPPAVSQPIQHKIYELQQQQSGGLLGRSSSTKPSTSGMGHAQTVHIGPQGPMSGGSNVSPAVDMALMRPNSAISAVGYHQQPQNLQMQPTGQLQSQQSNRHCPAGAPSPIGGIGVSGGNGSVVHLPPPHHSFFPPLPSMIAGAAAQFGISAAPSILAAAAQQQMAALRRNNNGSVAHSGGGGIHQQQQAVPVTQHPTASLMHPFIPQGLSPGMLAAAAAASNFDLNALQHYAATLIGSAPSADGVPPPAGQQQQQPNQK